MKKDQHIIACVETPDTADPVIAYATYCARRLNNKGVILLNVGHDGDNQWLKNYHLPYIGLKGDWSTAIEALPTTFGGILAVAGVNPKARRTSITHPSTLLRAFAQCKTAFLTVNTNSKNITPGWPLTTTFTVDHRRESKEKFLWASYMARFFNSKLIAVSPEYHDSGLRQQQYNNIRFLDKLFKPLCVDYTTATIPDSPTLSPDRAVLHKLHPDLHIAITTDTRERDIIDWVMGRPEKRLLQHSPETPILFLNQRDDLYILCD